MTSLNQLIKIIENAENIHVSVCDISGISNNEIFSLPIEKHIHSMKFCDLAKATSEGFELCMRCKGICNKMSVRKKQPFAGRCVFGQYEIVYPVCAGESVICIIYIGNLAADLNESVNKLRIAVKKTGGNFDEMSQQLSKMQKIGNNEKYFEIAELISDKQMSVRETEIYIKSKSKIKKAAPKISSEVKMIIKETETVFSKSLGTKVKIKDSNGKGKIEISYFSHDEFDRLSEILKNLQ